MTRLRDVERPEEVHGGRRVDGDQRRAIAHPVRGAPREAEAEMLLVDEREVAPTVGSHGWPEIVADGLAARVEHDEVAVDADRRGLDG